MDPFSELSLSGLFNWIVRTPYFELKTTSFSGSPGRESIASPLSAYCVLNQHLGFRLVSSLQLLLFVVQSFRGL